MFVLQRIIYIAVWKGEFTPSTHAKGGGGVNACLLDVNEKERDIQENKTGQ